MHLLDTLRKLARALFLRGRSFSSDVKAGAEHLPFAVFFPRACGELQLWTGTRRAGSGTNRKRGPSSLRSVGMTTKGKSRSLAALRMTAKDNAKSKRSGETPALPRTSLATATQ